MAFRTTPHVERPEMSLGKSFAERLRWQRRRQGKSQSVVAGLAGLNAEYVGQIERGQRTPTLDTIEALSEALSVPVTDLLGDVKNTSTDPTDKSVASRLHGALHSTTIDADPEGCPSDLRERVDQAWEIWQGAPDRYSRLLPLIVPLVEDAVRYGAVAAGTEDFSLLTDAYGLLRTIARRINRNDLALLAAERGLRTAERSEDPVRVASSRWNLAHALLGLGEHASAQEVAQETIHHIGPLMNRELSAITGALWLTAATARARSGDTFGALQLIDERATSLADMTGETNVGKTCFGPVNVAMHVMNIELEGGRAGSALAMADRLDVSPLASRERHTTWALDLARGHVIQHDPGTAMVYLLQAEASGPEDLRYNIDAHETLRRVLRRSRPALRTQAISLIRRLGLEETVLSN